MQETKRSLVMAAAGMLMLLDVSPAWAEGALAVSLGGRSMNNENFWDPLEHQGRAAVQADLAMDSRLPLWWSIGFGVSGDDHGTDGDGDYQTAGIVDAGLGLKLMPHEGVIRPYVGAGVQRSWVSLETNASSQAGNGDTDSDISRGWYADGGAMFWIGRHANVSVNLRWVKDTQVVLFGQRGDIDGRIYTVGGGYTWGGAPRRAH